MSSCGVKGKMRNKLLPTCCSAIFSLSEMRKWRQLIVTLEEERGLGEQERGLREEERGVGEEERRMREEGRRLGEEERGVEETRARVPEMVWLR